MSSSLQSNRRQSAESFFNLASVSCWWSLIMIKILHILYCLFVYDASESTGSVFSHAIVSSPEWINALIIVEYISMSVLFFAMGYTVYKRRVNRLCVLSIIGVLLHILFDVILLGVPFSGHIVWGEGLWMIFLWAMAFASFRLWLYMRKNKKDLTTVYLYIVVFTFVCAWIKYIRTVDLSDIDLLLRLNIVTFDIQHWFASFAVLFAELWLLVVSLENDIDIVE